MIAENRVLTNAHNLHGDEVTVTFADGRTADAKALGVDADGDLAVLEVPTDGARAIEPGADVPGIGTPVVALGNPNGHGPRVTVGFVSGTGRSFRGPRGPRPSPYWTRNSLRVPPGKFPDPGRAGLDVCRRLTM